jgi:hypothetical protein
MTALERLSMMLQIRKAFVLYFNPQLSPEMLCGALGENLPIPCVIANLHGEIISPAEAEQIRNILLSGRVLFLIDSHSSELSAEFSRLWERYVEHPRASIRVGRFIHFSGKDANRELGYLVLVLPMTRDRAQVVESAVPIYVSNAENLGSRCLTYLRQSNSVAVRLRSQ